mgnify:CR=1 FL=1
MANEKNLVSLATRTQQERKEIARKGQKASTAVKRRRKTFREIFETILAQEIPPTLDLGAMADIIKEQYKDKGITYDDAMGLAMTVKAVQGDTKAFELVRDTIGQKPSDKIKIDDKINIKVDIIDADAQKSK